MFKVNSISILIISSILFISCNTTSEDDNYDSVIKIEAGEELSTSLEWKASDKECTVPDGESSLETTPGHSANWVDFDIDRENETVSISGSTTDPGTYQVNYINNYLMDQIQNCVERSEEVRIKIIVEGKS